MIAYLATFCRTHRFALLVALLVGVIYIAPHLLSQWSLGDEYQGIPIMLTANEDEYLLRMQEILDGHPSLGSPVFFEYKDQPALSPPAGEFLYVLPTLVFGISPAVTLTASRFILPAVLFLLVYFLLFKMGEKGEMGEQETMEWRKVTAIAGALFVTLGYDLIDYRTVWSYLSGAASPGQFLIWSRPVNPILGAIFLFSFLLLVWAIAQNSKRRQSAVVGASVFLALMFGSYFFSWGIALSVLAALILLLFFRKEYKTAGTLAAIVPLGVLFSLPYWIAVWRAAQSPWYEASVLRSGLFLTHYPLLNKLLLAALLFFVLALAVDFWWKRKKQGPTRKKQGPTLTLRDGIKPWSLFCLALLLGGMWAYSQQIITGRTVWPYHFVQYTIPFSMVVGMTVLQRIIREYSKYAWGALVLVAAVSSLVFGVYTQFSVYAASREQFVALQNSRPLFDWLNAQEKDCVVLQAGGGEGPGGFDNIIPAFTHCNLYDSSWVFSLLPEERIRHNYLVRLFLKGVTPETVDAYLVENQHEARGRLYTNWKGLYGVLQFPDFADDALPARIAAIADEYRRFYAPDMTAALKKYRLDVIISAAPLPESVAKRLPTIAPIAEVAGNFIYKLRVI